MNGPWVTASLWPSTLTEDESHTFPDVGKKENWVSLILCFVSFRIQHISQNLSIVIEVEKNQKKQRESMCQWRKSTTGFFSYLQHVFTYAGTLKAVPVIPSEEYDYKRGLFYSEYLSSFSEM